MRKLKETLLIVAAFSFIISVLIFQTTAFCGNNNDEWIAPENEARKQNPIPSDANSIAAGKAAYIKHCFSCHGTLGKGDGPAAGALTKSCGDLSDPNMWKQSDGTLFWKITTGKTPMPYYEKRLKENQRWEVVNYIRTLAPRPNGKSRN